ncbi:thiosulfate oxidation carrier complex protein SoxZ [Siccirubricoccus sp. KC 17139]|uniref:Thiosulfate oxidation carrier complex protein SoxZ n=1 Tax=Siccirubricoccus soli TaxID=2899147 RepID=A0ABT1CZF6_9PROT|nr:thiosulfate oxidation carrier complex protein SoxZ [Siccirubricoccus soli]MCO6415058.1 thiosulfate oxidation carrier complex protein SoxZ [Siccirubricoccus soli]MCP2681189.1 thiosulfate oxidation carrier complex protein SoxZ [Siccirubricoccus soli]
MARVLLNIPRTARKGEVIAIRTLIQHVMETGYRPGADGEVLPRDIIRRFTASFEGEEVFAADLSPAIAANPFLSFTMVASTTGTLVLRWQGDKGFDQTETREIMVTG